MPDEIQGQASGSATAGGTLAGVAASGMQAVSCASSPISCLLGTYDDVTKDYKIGTGTMIAIVAAPVLLIGGVVAFMIHSQNQMVKLASSPLGQALLPVAVPQLAAPMALAQARQAAAAAQAPAQPPGPWAAAAPWAPAQAPAPWAPVVGKYKTEKF